VNAIFLHVRQGFEGEALQELEVHLKELDINSTAFSEKPPTDIGFVMIPIDRIPNEKIRRALRFESLIFTRQLLWVTAKVNLPDGDRITALMEAISQELISATGANALSALSIETPDTDKAKELSRFCKSLTRPLENALNRLRKLPKGKGAAHLPRSHVILLSSSEALVAFSDVGNSSPWVMGIPRLKFPSDAPSRSTLKLEEAFHVFIPEWQTASLLKPGMLAVDLGACPGGWTYQLVRRKIRTIAVDNGAISPSLMQTGLVTHLTEDAFTFRPQSPVDWLVCDVVEQPSRISELIAMWFMRGYCKFSIFNLKLPMKRRFEEVNSCLNHLHKTCAQEGLTLQIKAKQLYHDRKEVTVFAHLSLKS
jgi:23S rRNA (cytidine2498-2'-O)-methyltransferase